MNVPRTAPRAIFCVLVLLGSALLASACDVQVVQAGCDRFTISFDDGGKAGNDGTYPFEAYAGSTKIGSAPGTVSSSRTTLTIPLSPAQPTGTVIHIGINGGGGLVPVASAACSSNGNLVTWFTPGDNREDPRPGDRVAAYCDPTNGVVTVYLVKPDSAGVFGTTFNYKNLLAAGKTGLSMNKGADGVVSLSTDGKGNFWLAWNGGQYGADGQPGHGFAKGFTCDFSSAS